MKIKTERTAFNTYFITLIMMSINKFVLWHIYNKLKEDTHLVFAF